MYQQDCNSKHTILKRKQKLCCALILSVFRRIVKYNCFVSYYFNQIVLVCNCEMKITVNYKLLFIVTVKEKSVNFVLTVYLNSEI